MKIIAVIFLLILSSCSLGGRPESTIYAIRPMALDEQSCKLPLNLQVSEPTTSPGLDTRRIAVYENSQRLNFYTNARWTAPAPEMLQTALVEGFEKAKTFKSVSTDMDATSADVILLTDIRSYQVEGTAVNVRYVSKLIDAETRDVVATMEIEKSQTPSEHKIENIIEAFASATNDSVKEVIEKTLSSYPTCKFKPIKLQDTID
jgi:cholesterol transport system auxiliary component